MAAFRKTRRVLATVLALVICSACWISAIALFMNATWPTPSEETDPLIHVGGFTLDPTQLSSGYFLARQEPCSNALKLRVTKDKVVYTYDLNNEGEYEVFPLQLGNGTYECEVYKNVKGNKYSKEAEVKFEVELDSEYAPFLSPSQYVYYTPETLAVNASYQLCEGLQTDEEKLNTLRAFIRENFVYDYERASKIREFYLGDADMCFETRKGLCQDYAVMLASMLRVQGIPTKLVIGYAENIYHAWNMVLIDGEYRLIDVTAELGGVERFGSYTAERYY